MTGAALKIELEGDLANDVRAAAEARGLSPEDFVRQQLTFDIALDAEVGNPLDWEEDMRRLEEPGENIPLDEAFDRLDAKLRAAAKAK